jgi:hypothetical protein
MQTLLHSCRLQQVLLTPLPSCVWVFSKRNVTMQSKALPDRADAVLTYW